MSSEGDGASEVSEEAFPSEASDDEDAEEGEALLPKGALEALESPQAGFAVAAEEEAAQEALAGEALVEEAGPEEPADPLQPPAAREEGAAEETEEEENYMDKGSEKEGEKDGENEGEEAAAEEEEAWEEYEEDEDEAEEDEVAAESQEEEEEALGEDREAQEEGSKRGEVLAEKADEKAAGEDKAEEEEEDDAEALDEEVATHEDGALEADREEEGAAQEEAATQEAFVEEDGEVAATQECAREADAEDAERPGRGEEQEKARSSEEGLSDYADEDVSSPCTTVAAVFGPMAPIDEAVEEEEDAPGPEEGPGPEEEREEEGPLEDKSPEEEGASVPSASRPATGCASLSPFMSEELLAASGAPSRDATPRRSWEALCSPTRAELSQRRDHFEGWVPKEELQRSWRLECERKAKSAKSREVDQFLSLMRERGEGRVTVAWRRYFDVDGDGELDFGHFCGALTELGWRGDALNLWHELLPGFASTMQLETLDPEGAQVLAFFGDWCYRALGGPLEAFRAMDEGGSESLTCEEFLTGLQVLKFFAQELPKAIRTKELAARNLFALLDVSGYGCVMTENVLFLERDREKRLRLRRELEVVRKYGADKSEQPLPREATKLLHGLAMANSPLGGRHWAQLPDGSLAVGTPAVAPVAPPRRLARRASAPAGRREEKLPPMSPQKAPVPPLAMHLLAPAESPAPAKRQRGPRLTCYLQSMVPPRPAPLAAGKLRPLPPVVKKRAAEPLAFDPGEMGHFVSAARERGLWEHYAAGKRL